MISVALLLSFYTYHRETSYRLPMSWACTGTLWILGSKGLSSRSQCIEYWKLYEFLYTYYHETSLKDSTWVEDVPHLFLGQRSRSQCIDSWKCFLPIIAFPLQPTSWKFTQRLPLSLGCALLILGPKVKVAMQWFLKIVCVYNCFHFTHKHLETSHTDFPWVQEVWSSLGVVV